MHVKNAGFDVGAWRVVPARGAGVISCARSSRCGGYKTGDTAYFFHSEPTVAKKNSRLRRTRKKNRLPPLVAVEPVLGMLKSKVSRMASQKA